MARYHARKLAMPMVDKSGDCECCGTAVKVLCWDHCHATGQHRGWLCRKCNAGIGLLGDSLSGVQLAVKYLTERQRV